jgi:hypothetical protein
LQTLISVVFQLDEAKRYIQDGRLQQLRVALLLLDNAAELQMDRRIQLDLRLAKGEIAEPSWENPHLRCSNSGVWNTRKLTLPYCWGYRTSGYRSSVNRGSSAMS